MTEETLDLIDCLYEEAIKTFPKTDRESFTAGAEALLNWLIENKKI